jgi:tRNA dimethylallyltransferase
MSSSDVSDAPELRVICGPTGAGKSAIAMHLAGRFGAEIVSADSRQVYRGFDIGTAKPSPDERARVRHHGIDVAGPTERYSANAWARGAEQWISGIAARGRRALVVGGTGFYVQALVAPLFPAPALDPGARARLDTELAALPVDELRRWCRALDPARAGFGRTQLLRAIETALLTGRRLSDLHAAAPRRARPVRYLLVDPGAALARWIEGRVDGMFAAGWADEARTLDRTVPPDAPAWNACGYRDVVRLARGDVSSAAAREAVVISTRQYAKRQRTWFRHQLTAAAVTRCDPTDPQHLDVAAAWWQTGDNAG